MKSSSRHCLDRLSASLQAGSMLLSLQCALAIAPAFAQDSFTSQPSLPASQPASDVSAAGSTSSFIPTSMLDSPAVNQSQTGNQTQPFNNAVGNYPGVQGQNLAPADSAVGFAGQAGFGVQPTGNASAGDKPNADAQNKDGKKTGSIFDPQNEKPVYGELTKKKNGAEGEPEAGDPEAAESPMDFSSAPPPSKTSSTPLGVAVNQVKLGHLPDALKSINSLLQSDATNANAHYLKAVVLVLDRNFADARLEYQSTLKYSHSEELNNRARAGLSKLSR